MAPNNQQIEKLDERIRELEKKMAGCRREDCAKDHDRITQMVTIMEQTVESNAKLIESVHAHSVSIETMGGNVNQVASIVQDIVKNDKAKRTFFITVASGVLIAVLSALLFYCASALKQSLKAEIISSPSSNYQVITTERPIASHLQKNEGLENEKRRDSR